MMVLPALLALLAWLVLQQVAASAGDAADAGGFLLAVAGAGECSRVLNPVAWFVWCGRMRSQFVKRYRMRVESCKQETVDLFLRM